MIAFLIWGMIFGQARIDINFILAMNSLSMQVPASPIIIETNHLRWTEHTDIACTAQKHANHNET